MKIGANVSITGEGLLAAVKESLTYNANTFMIYTRSNRGGSARSIREFMVQEALELMQENGMNIKDAVVHAPFYINLAGEEQTRNKGIKNLKEEIKRTEELGIRYLVFHPGSHVKQGHKVGLNNVINSLNEVLTGRENLFVLLETMAGDGSKVGNSFEDIADIINGVEESKRHVLGVCMDTCHNYSYGYNIVDNFDGVLKEFNEIVGLEKLKVIHLNNSKYPMGARKDRHANIGAEDGYIPKETLRFICNHKLLENVPIILETPFGQYKEEIAYLKGDNDVSLSQNSLK